MQFLLILFIYRVYDLRNMMCTPESVSTIPDIWPTLSAKAAFSNGACICPAWREEERNISNINPTKILYICPVSYLVRICPNHRHVWPNCSRNRIVPAPQTWPRCSLSYCDRPRAASGPPPWFALCSPHATSWADGCPCVWPANAGIAPRRLRRHHRRRRQSWPIF